MIFLIFSLEGRTLILGDFVLFVDLGYSSLKRGILVVEGVGLDVFGGIGIVLQHIADDGLASKVVLV